LDEVNIIYEGTIEYITARSWMCSSVFYRHYSGFRS